MLSAGILRPVSRIARHHQRFALLAIAIVACLLLPAAASAWTLRYTNPLRDSRSGRPLSCPDPAVTYAPPASRGYVLVCTSGPGRDAFPIYTSTDLVHWKRHGYVFPRGHEPWWALRSTGRSSGGLYWAPQLNRIAGRWVVYFAAKDNSDRLALGLPDGTTAPTGRMVIGFGTATSLAGPWRTGVLHYGGQLPSASSVPEPQAPAIDPSAVEDPAAARIYLFWADQPNQIWSAQLSAGGTTLQGPVHQVLTPSEPFECDPRNDHCTIEAPEPFYADGGLFMLYSGASTWDSSYTVGVAEASSPFGPFEKLDQPLISSYHGFYSTGPTYEPILGPDGSDYILYHARTRPGQQHDEATRYLMLGRLSWLGGWPQISAP